MSVFFAGFLAGFASAVIVGMVIIIIGGPDKW